MGKKKERVNTHQPIGGILKQLREMQRYSKTDYAKMVGVSKNHIGEIEDGSCFPSHAKLVKMLYIFGYELTIRRIPKFPQSGERIVSSESIPNSEETLVDTPAPECSGEDEEDKKEKDKQ